MKKYLSVYANWRNIVLCAIFTVSLFLLLGEAESWGALIISKCIGIAGFLAFYSLLNYWNTTGKIKETQNMREED
jgi:hypothetical protein